MNREPALTAMSHGSLIRPATFVNGVIGLGVPFAARLNRYRVVVQPSGAVAATTNVCPSPVATLTRSAAGNGRLIRAPCAPVVALATNIDGCCDQFSTTKYAGVVSRAGVVWPAVGLPRPGPGAARGSSTATTPATAMTATAAASGIRTRIRDGPGPV